MRLCALLCLGLVALLVPVGRAESQALQPKAAVTPTLPADACIAFAPPPSAALTSTAAVDSLLAAGSTAAILGDSYSAGELLREASELDPGNPVIAYRLARIYDERGETDLALHQYCRYLQVAPQADDSDHVRERVQALAEASNAVDIDEVEAAARAGLRALEQRRYDAAALAFRRALEMRPYWSEAHYNHGLALAALGQEEAAAAELQRYLELQPDADDQTAVLARVEQMRMEGSAPPRVALAPAAALAGGLLLPGMGQIATGRPVGGILLMAGAAGAVYWGLQEQRTVRQEMAEDPFGNPYPIDVVSVDRPNLALGLGAAAAAALVGATEAYLHARRNGPARAASRAGEDEPPRVGLHIGADPAMERVEIGVRWGR